jgi:hypothetical protein|tara:strand:- start:184 stop:387 length:204 start_codon:yes stop_codon:yes gene_type:complete
MINKLELIDMIDTILMKAICGDIQNETLLTEMDDETLELLLIGIWEDLESNDGFGEFARFGVNVGEA